MAEQIKANTEVSVSKQKSIQIERPVLTTYVSTEASTSNKGQQKQRPVQTKGHKSRDQYKEQRPVQTQTSANDNG